MAVFIINYCNGRKMMQPVADKETYLKLRQNDEQRRITEAARKGETFTNKRGEEVSVKTRLQQYVYSCLPNEDGSLAKSKRMSNAVAMDIDYPGGSCGFSLDEWKQITKNKVMAKQKEVGALMFGDSATKGFHLVFGRKDYLTQEENLRWASGILDVPFDECAKDHTRVMFEPSGEIYLLEDELFEVKEVAVACDSRALLSKTAIPSPYRGEGCQQGRIGASLMYTGFLYSDIVAKYWEMFNDGNEPCEGDRNVKTYELAMVLRHICDYSVEKLMQVIPNYWAKTDGKPSGTVAGAQNGATAGAQNGTVAGAQNEAVDSAAEAEWRKTIENAVKEPRKGMPYRLRQVLNALKDEKGIRATGGTMTMPPAMPKKLPPLIKLLTKNVPWYYKPAVASAVFPALAAHLHGVKFRYWDNVDHEATFMNLLVGRQSVGKGCIKKPIEYILADIIARDLPNREREAEWKRNNPSGKTKAKDPRPKDICIQVLIDNLTDAVFNQRIVDANNNGERYVYTIVDEIEALKKVTSKGTIDEVSLLIRKAFDNSMAGQERVGADSVSGIAPLRWNWNASTTPPNARKFFYKAVNDGTISRLDVSTIMLNDDEDEDPVIGIYDNAFSEDLKPYIDRLENANGLIECPAAKRLALQMKQENKDTAKLYESEAYKVLSFRGNVIAWLKGMVLYVAGGYKWTKEIADFVRWSQNYNLWCKMLYFGQQLESELREEKVIQRQSGPQNILDLLKDDFTEADLEMVRAQQGKDGDGKATLRQWKKRGHIEWDDIQQCWHKTEAYVKVHSS